jgi:hypothetical protein
MNDFIVVIVIRAFLMDAERGRLRPVELAHIDPLFLQLSIVSTYLTMYV